MNSLKRANECDAVYTPAIDIHETDEALYLTTDLPGVKREDLELSVNRNVLEIQAMPTAVAPAEAKAIYQESPRGRFYRSFILGEEVNADGIEAKLTDGVLTLRLPKADRFRPRKINIQP